MIIEKLSKYHKKDKFDCENTLLNEFLKKYAYQNQYRHLIGVTYVAHIDNSVIGYITISVSSIKRASIDSNKPYDDIPVLKIARLAIDKLYQKRGIGKKLLKFAIYKAIELKENYGCVGIIVDAKPESVSFYEYFGFVRIKSIEKHIKTSMYLSLKTIKQTINLMAQDYQVNSEG